MYSDLRQINLYQYMKVPTADVSIMTVESRKFFFFLGGETERNTTLFFTGHKNGSPSELEGGGAETVGRREK